MGQYCFVIDSSAIINVHTWMSATTKGSKRSRGSISNVHFTIGYLDLNFGKFIFDTNFMFHLLKWTRYRNTVFTVNQIVFMDSLLNKKYWNGQPKKIQYPWIASWVHFFCFFNNQAIVHACTGQLVNKLDRKIKVSAM